MFIALNLPDGTLIYVNSDNITYFEPRKEQSLELLIHFTDGTSIYVAQIPPQIRALLP